MRPYLDTEKRPLQLYYVSFPNWTIIYPFFLALYFRQLFKYSFPTRRSSDLKFFTSKVAFLGKCFHKRQAKSPQHASPSKRPSFDHFLPMRSEERRVGMWFNLLPRQLFCDYFSKMC